MVRILSSRRGAPPPQDSNGGQNEPFEILDIPSPPIEPSLPESVAVRQPSGLDQHQALNAAFDGVITGHSSLDLSPVEYNSRLRSVLAENLQLRETLQQNNLALQQQFQVLSKWKMDIVDCGKENSEKLVQLRNVVEELKKENQELKKDKKKKEKEEKKGKDKDKDKGKQAEKQNDPQTSKANDERKSDKANTDVHERLVDLTERLEVAEERAEKLSDDLEQVTAQKTALERDIGGLRGDKELLKASNDGLLKEKWELSNANAELQNRLQQSMAMTYMTGTPDNALQEEIRKMQMQLADERKVTEKLSRNLELEKRKVESLEQRLKGGTKKKSNTHLTHLPDEMRNREEKLADSMEKYRIQCETLSGSLEDCEEKLTGFAIQEEYHVDDLRHELNKLKRLLSEEKRRSSQESHKLYEVGSMFANVFREYNQTLETMNELQNERKVKSQQQSVYDDIRDSSHASNVDSLTAKLLQMEEELENERARNEQMVAKMKQMELDVEAIPILQAQVEVYQSDFNAEREAREKIAGQKADIEEELRKLKQRQHHETDWQANQMDRYRAAETTVPTAPTVRSTINNLAERQATASTYRPYRDENDQAAQNELRCPRCNAKFDKLQPLEAHVNECLDKSM